jgi:arginyl-tRNA synthetase
MLALNGNTAPYILYAYTRVRSIFRKADGFDFKSQIADLKVSGPEELTLARHLLNFGLVLEAVAEECRPNFLCNYLYELAGHFSRFFEACPVLKAEGGVRVTRLALCDLTGRVLRQGLDALGIETTEQM